MGSFLAEYRNEIEWVKAIKSIEILEKQFDGLMVQSLNLGYVIDWLLLCWMHVKMLTTFATKNWQNNTGLTSAAL